MSATKLLGALAIVVSVSLLPDLLFAQPGPQGKGLGKGMDVDRRADMELIHFLLDHRSDMARKVTKLPNGIESVTESDDPMIVEKLQAHVASMHRRLEEKRPIHARDPLFAAIFRNTDKISMKVENTRKGVRVVETSDDPSAARLIQAHAEVVSLFLKNGRSEMRKDHEPPEKE